MNKHKIVKRKKRHKYKHEMLVVKTFFFRIKDIKNNLAYEVYI